MPQVHYPFIDVAVHPAVRARFAAGDAVVLFSRDMKDVLWANGAGARQFGHREIYDLIDSGPEAGSVSFRQLAAAAAQLATVGDRRGFVMRTTQGFRSTAVQADVSLIAVGRDECVMFAAPSGFGEGRLAGLLSGFDDPDTHMAVLDAEGAVLVASDGFGQIGVMQDTARALIAAASRSADGLVKRPIPSGSGYLPAAIGRLADDLYLLFCVETSIGRMDAPEEREMPAAPLASALPVPDLAEPVAEDAPVEAVADQAADTDWAPGVVADAGLEPVDADGDVVAATEEDAAEADIDDLALIDGARAEDIEAASADDDLADAGSLAESDQPTELDADMAESTAEDDRAALEPSVASMELAGDLVETSDDAAPAPEAFVEAEALDAAAADPEAVFAQGGDDPEAQARVEDVAEAVLEMDAGERDAGAEPTTSDAEIDAADVADGEGDVSGDEAAFAVEGGAENEDASQENTAAESASDADMGDIDDMGAADETSALGEPDELGETDDSLEADAPLTEDMADTKVAAVEPIGSQHEAEADVSAGFNFNPGARPVRFVWKLDANGVFAEVSGEFAATVGPNAGDIVGQSFRDLASLFALDPDQEISGLLERRDTWSGRTVKWPVEGTELVVPVDLAALPTYSRNREFDGFRGFGIIRVVDAEADPHGFGLHFLDDAAEDDFEDGATEPVEVPSEPASDEAVPAEDSPTDEFRGEVPALQIVSNPLATFSDKIVQLEARRAKANQDGLSASEQAALKEIARRLEPFGKRPNEELEQAAGELREDGGEAVAEGHVDAEDRVPVETVAETSDSADDAAEAVDAATPDVDVEETVPDAVDLDDEEAQSLFEDLGAGPGLTPYALNQVPMAILIHAGDRLIEANDEFRRLTGYDSIAALDRVGGLDALITRREGADAGVYLVRADGTQVLVSARLQSVRYEGASALMLALTPAAGTIVPVTTDPQVIVESEPARKLAALAVEVDELRSILETATDGVIVLDTEGRIRSLNRSASALFNFDDAEIRGKPFAMLFAHESQKSVQDYLAGLAGHGVASVLNDGREVIGREASGGFIPLFMTMGRMPGSNSYCAVIRDITQWKRSEEELKAAKRAAETANQHKSDFLARVSHEIRTPLNAIIGFSDMIASEHFGPAGHSRYVEYAADIGRSGRHVLDIVNDLLDISKIEAGEMDLDFAAVGLNDCVSEAVSLVQPQANAQRVIIRTSLSQSVPDVVADLRSVKQIALNILANAIRYTPSGGQIVVSTAYETSGAVTLRIRDTGVGMSKAELEQAMKPFGQVAPGTRQRGDGTGLGLPLTKAMTEANRASFAILSAPNEGTLVEISFPPQRVLAD